VMFDSDNVYVRFNKLGTIANMDVHNDDSNKETDPLDPDGVRPRSAQRASHMAVLHKQVRYEWGL